MIGQSALSNTGGTPNSLGPGLKFGDMIRCWVYSPRKSNSAPDCQYESRIAFVAWIHSAICLAGLSQRDPYRFSMWTRTCDPRPNRTVPDCRSADREPRGPDAAASAAGDRDVGHEFEVTPTAAVCSGEDVVLPFEGEHTIRADSHRLRDARGDLRRCAVDQ